MSLSSFHLAVCGKNLRFDVFTRLTPRLGTTALAFALFYFSFFIGAPYGLNATFGQTYSSDKTSWKSTRPRLESVAPSVSDVASKRAEVLLKSIDGGVSTSRAKTKSQSEPNASSLRTFSPKVDSSSMISSSSFSEKKVDLYVSSDGARKLANSAKEKQNEFADKEKLFGELERRGHISLLDQEHKIESSSASFELTEPAFDEGVSSKDSFPEIAPFPSDSDSPLFVSLDEEVEGVQDTRKNNYVSGLELFGSDLESEQESPDDKTSASYPLQTNGEPGELKDVENASNVDESIETEFDASTIELDEQTLLEEDNFESELKTFDAFESESTDEIEEAEAYSTELDEFEATQDEEPEGISEAESSVKPKGNVDESNVSASARRVEKIAAELEPTSSLSEVNTNEVDLEESDFSPKEETDSEESDVPKTGSIPPAPSTPTRFSIPSHSILSLDEEEEESEDELALASTEAADVVKTQTIKNTDDTPRTFAEETEEDAPTIVSELDESDESSETDEEEREEIRATIQEESNDEEEAQLESSAKVESYDDFSTSTAQDRRSKSDERLLSKLRVFQRGRQRRLFNGRLLETPAPPSIDDIDPEFANQRSEPPLLTKENANLPSLEVEGTVKANKPEAESIDAEKFREEAKKFAWTKGAFTITPYGFLNLSVAADTQRSVPGEFILYVQSPEVDNSSDFSVDARTSRLGLDVAGPRVEALDADVGGKVEFDFQGTVNGSKNKGGLQLRRAYVELVDKQRERKFLAGQDWEIISPVAPQMLNYLPLGFVGDMQYRRAQVRFEQGWTYSPDLRVLGQVAVCDNVLSDYVSTSGVSAATSGWPVLEARVSGAFFGGVRDGLPITLGVSGHIGEQNYKFSALAGVPMASTSVKKPIKTWSVNFDLDAPITKTQKIQGEFFTGANLSTFCGGINQGVDLVRREGIRCTGGWLAWHSDCTEKLDVNFGYGIDRPNEKDLVGTSSPSNGYTTARTQNQVYFTNCIYNWTPFFMTGIETSVWQTDYQKAYVASDAPIFYEMEAGKSTRIEFVTRLSF